MTRYFTAVLSFMVVSAIVGIMFDGYGSRQGTVDTVIVSLVAAILVYVFGPKDPEVRSVKRTGTTSLLQSGRSVLMLASNSG